MKQLMTLFISVMLASVFSSLSSAEAPTIPKSVMDISKENTYPNPSQNLPYLQPSELTKELIKTSNVPIENPVLIKMLNESSITPSPTAIGYRAAIYLGRWALNYESEETTVNWEYQKINTNFFDNRGGKSPVQISYKQEAQKRVKGGLTARISDHKDVKKLMLMKAAKKSKMPLAFETIVGFGTKKIKYIISRRKKWGIYTHTFPLSTKKEKSLTEKCI